MGFKMEFNWVLKLKPEQGLNESDLEEDETYNFSKDGYRVYPVGMPIDLINKDWGVVGKVAVTESKNYENKTSGKYRVLKIYEDEEREILTRNCKRKYNL